MTQRRSPFRRSAAQAAVRVTGTEAEILVYDEIGFFGVEAGPFVAEIRALEVDTIHLRLNSPGGDVFDGVAMANALREHRARVVVHIDGLAASIASVLAMAGDEIRMAADAFLMIHDPWMIAMGNADELRKDAELLEKVGNASIVPAYLARTTATEAELRAWLAEETWFTADEAVDAGFADAVEAREAEAVAGFDLSVFAHVPTALRVAAADAKRDVETTLREAGLSRRDAKIAAAVFTDRRPREAATTVGPAIQSLITTLRGH